MRAVKKKIEKFEMGREQWDLIIAMYTHGPLPRVSGRIVEALKPAGLLVVEVFYQPAKTSHGWSIRPIPQTEWIEVTLPSDNANYAPYGDFFQFFQGGKLMAVRFDPKTRAVSDPYEVKYVPRTTDTMKSDDGWGIRGPGLVFGRRWKGRLLYVIPSVVTALATVGVMWLVIRRQPSVYFLVLALCQMVAIVGTLFNRMIWRKFTKAFANLRFKPCL